METLKSEIQALKNTLASLQDPDQLSNRLGNLSLDETGAPTHRQPKTTAAKVQYFSNSPGENFLSWRAQFQVIATLNRWTNSEAKSMAFAYMRGHALDTVLDISITEEHQTLADVLEKYQLRFLHSSRSQMLRAQFHCVVQLPNESIQRLHARMRVLYNLAYPDVHDRSDIFLTERFVAALNNREVQNYVRRRKPSSFEEALEIANEETSFVLMDLATHAPGGLQQPLPGDSTFVASLRPQQAGTKTPARNAPSAFRSSEPKKCYYCEEAGHLRECCPYRLKDLLRQRQTRTGRYPVRTNSTTTPSKRVAGYSPAARRQVRFSAEARQTPPFVTDGYGKGQVATLEEPSGAQDVLEEVDLATLDEQTIAVLYEGLDDDLPPDHEDGEDFLQGQ